MELMCRETRCRVRLVEGDTIEVGRRREWQIIDNRVSRCHCRCVLLKGKTVEVWNDTKELYIERKTTRKVLEKRPGSRSRIKTGDVFYLLNDDGELRFRFELRSAAAMPKKSVETVKASGLFSGLRFVFVTTSHIVPLRRKLLEHGGVEVAAMDVSVDFGIVSDDGAELEREVDKAPKGMRLVKRSYISDCLIAERRLDVEKYVVELPDDEPDVFDSPEPAPPPSPPFIAQPSNLPSSSSHRPPQSEGVAFGELSADYDWIESYDVEKARATVEKLFTHWTRYRSIGHDVDRTTSDDSEPDLAEEEGMNRVCNHTACRAIDVCFIEQLHRVRRQYHGSRNDQFRIKAIDKAVRVLESLRKPLKTVHHIEQLELGQKTTSKVIEILNKGYVQRAVEMGSDVHELQFRKFSQVWGAEDVQSRFHLTETQRVGLKYYDDFLKKIPRSEVAEIYSQIKACVIRVMAQLTHSTQRRCQSQLFCATLGSFVRGKAAVGDVDILISPPEPTAFTASFLLQEILKELLKQQLITSDLHPDTLKQSKDASASWMGVCPSSSGVYRRVDIKLYQRSSLPFALNYFIGSRDFVRALRYWCNRPTQATAQLAQTHAAGANAFQLSDHALSLAQRPSPRAALNLTGAVVPCATETQIFEALGLDYVPPWMRIFANTL